MSDGALVSAEDLTRVYGSGDAEVRADEGLTLTIPFGTVVMLLVLAVLAGILAAIGPARGASRLDVLEALAYE